MHDGAKNCDPISREIQTNPSSTAYYIYISDQEEEKDKLLKQNEMNHIRLEKW